MQKLLDLQDVKQKENQKDLLLAEEIRSNQGCNGDGTVVPVTGHHQSPSPISPSPFSPVFIGLHRSLSPFSPVFIGLHRSLSPFSPVFTGHFHRFHRSTSVTFIGFTSHFHRFHRSSLITVTGFTDHPLHRSSSVAITSDHRTI